MFRFLEGVPGFAIGNVSVHVVKLSGRSRQVQQAIWCRERATFHGIMPTGRAALSARGVVIERHRHCAAPPVTRLR